MQVIQHTRKSISIRFSLLGYILFVIVAQSVNAFEVTGEVDWLHRVELGTPVKGVIRQVNVSSGMIVEKGDLLLELDQRGFRARVDALKARLSNHKAVFEEAQRERDRALELYDRTVLSEHDLQVAKNDFIAADADYKITRAELVQAKLDLEYSRLRAPFDGLVIARNAEVGQSVVPDLKPVVLFVLADTQHLKAVAYLKPDQVDDLKTGMQATLVTKAEKFTGYISEIALEPAKDGNLQDKRYRLSVEFDTSGKILRIGSPISISLP